MRKFICYLKRRERCVMGSLRHKAFWQSLSHAKLKNREMVGGPVILFSSTRALGGSPFDLQVSSIYDFQLSMQYLKTQPYSVRTT